MAKKTSNDSTQKFSNVKWGVEEKKEFLTDSDHVYWRNAWATVAGIGFICTMITLIAIFEPGC